MTKTRANDISMALQSAVPILLTDIDGLIADKLLSPEEYVLKCLRDDERRANKFFDIKDEKHTTQISLTTAKKIADWASQLLGENVYNRVAFLLENVTPQQKNQLLNAWKKLAEKDSVYHYIFLYYSPTNQWTDKDIEWLSQRRSSAGICQPLLDAIKIKDTLRRDLSFEAIMREMGVRQLHLNLCDESFATIDILLNAEISLANLRRTDWSDGIIANFQFVNVDLSESNFNKVHFRDVTLTNVYVGNDIWISGTIKDRLNAKLVFTGNAQLGCYYFNSIFSLYPECSINFDIINLVVHYQNPIFQPLLADFVRIAEHNKTHHYLDNFPIHVDINKYYCACSLMGANDLQDFEARVRALPHEIVPMNQSNGFSAEVLNQVRDNFNRPKQVYDSKLTK